MDTLTIEHIDENTKRRNNRKLEETKEKEELKKSKEKAKKWNNCLTTSWKHLK